MQPSSDMMREYERQKRKRRKLLTSLLVVTTILLLHWSNAYGDTAPEITVDVALLVEAREIIDDLTFQLAVRDSVLDAQRDFYEELLVLKDRRMEVLEKAVKDSYGSPMRSLGDRVTWGMIGYGLRAALEK
jgi:hypothetical protein